jgi:hypothetical protein
MVGQGQFILLHVSTALVTEYEAVLKRVITVLSAEDIDNVVDFICSTAVRNKIFYPVLWFTGSRNGRFQVVPGVISTPHSPPSTP